MVIQLAEVGDAGFSEVPGALNANRVVTRAMSGKTLHALGFGLGSQTSDSSNVGIGSSDVPPAAAPIRSMTRIVDERDACTKSLHDTETSRQTAAVRLATSRLPLSLVGVSELLCITCSSSHMALTLPHYRTMRGVRKIISSSALSVRSVLLKSHPSKGIRCSIGVRLLRSLWVFS